MNLTCSSGDIDRDDGFSLIELLVVIVIIGILAAVVVFAVGGATDDAQTTSCRADRRTVSTAVEAYFAQSATDLVPAADATPDGYEKSLVAGGFMRQVSEWHDIDQDGQFVAVANSPC